MISPILSIIVPVYNVEPYLNECLDSILQQTFVDFELILVNDGSTDCSGEICDLYSLKDKRIKVIHKINEGLGYARNTGVKIAKGKFISFIDSDDWIEKEMYEKLINIAITNLADIIAFDYLRTDANKEKDNHVITFFNNYEALLNLFENKKIHWIVCDKVYSSHLFRDLAFENVNILEDVLFTPQILLKAKKIIHFQSTFYNYRIRQGSIMNSNSTYIKFEASMYVFEKVSSFFKNQKELKNYADALFCSSMFNWYFKINQNKEDTKEYYKLIKKKLILHFFSFTRNKKISYKFKILIFCSLLSSQFLNLFKKLSQILSKIRQIPV